MIDPLALRLWGYLTAAHKKWDVDLDPIKDLVHQHSEDVQYHLVGRTGVLAFIGDYVLAAWPDDERLAASRDVHRLTSQRLKERGFTLHMVYAMNLRSVKLTRKVGAVPIGVDADGFVHYRLDCANFPHHDGAVGETAHG